ncbi:MAG: hypothetical protein H8E46_01795 [FCB group bacterium]|nr:hypothetical protein [FCB group bacterium]
MDEKKIEQRIEEIAKNAEERIKKLGDQIEEKIVEKKLKETAEKIDRKIDEKINPERKSCSHRSSEFWGIALLILGFLFLADNFHWIEFDIPFWPLVMIIGGGYLIYSSTHRD